MLKNSRNFCHSKYFYSKCQMYEIWGAKQKIKSYNIFRLTFDMYVVDKLLNKHLCWWLYQYFDKWFNQIEEDKNNQSPSSAATTPNDQIKCSSQSQSGGGSGIFQENDHRLSRLKRWINIIYLHTLSIQLAHAFWAMKFKTN